MLAGWMFDALPARAENDDDEVDQSVAAREDARFYSTWDVAYGQHDLQKLDVYAPRDVKNAPVMVYVHGGGWRRGDKRMTGLKAGYFTGKGWLFVSVNYRLVPEGKHPRNAQDVASALSWVHREIGRYGGDLDKMFLMGHSAGCHLASLVAADERWLKANGLPLTTIKGVIALDSQAYNVPQLMADRPSQLYRTAFGDDPKLHRDASPQLNLARDKGVPPFLVMYSRGMGDVSSPNRRRYATDFAEALRAAGATAEVVDASDRNHADINRRFGDLADANVTGRAMKFLTGLLAGAPSTPAAK